jgi:hypothetical protein
VPLLLREEFGGNLPHERVVLNIEYFQGRALGAAALSRDEIDAQRINASFVPTRGRACPADSSPGAATRIWSLTSAPPAGPRDALVVRTLARWDARAPLPIPASAVQPAPERYLDGATSTEKHRTIFQPHYQPQKHATAHADPNVARGLEPGPAHATPGPPRATAAALGAVRQTPKKPAKAARRFEVPQSESSLFWCPSPC